MYYIVYGFLYLLSLLPLPVLHGISSFAYFLLYYVFKYRRKVVMNNLGIAFPELTQGEREKIAKTFYLNLTDTFLEIIKQVSCSKKFIQKHVQGNFDLLLALSKKHPQLQLQMGHNPNWEWANIILSTHVPHNLLGIYMPLSSKIMDRLFLKIRSKFGTIMMSATNMRAEMLPHRNKNYWIGVIADQNPGDPKFATWVNFFNRPTPFVGGPEKAATTSNLCVVFAFMKKIKRGYYYMHFETASEEASKTQPNELTLAYVKYLQNAIETSPSMYLWTHKRWKYEYKPEYGPILESKG
jgi:Kdo2-lipid IVA lauroyltransferase/acyltransferase